MADNIDLLKAIESLRSDVATKSDLEAIKKDMVTKKDLQEVKQAQAQANTTLKALEAGQEDIHDLRADLFKKLKSNENRIENLEEHTGTTNPTRDAITNFV